VSTDALFDFALETRTPRPALPGSSRRRHSSSQDPPHPRARPGALGRQGRQHHQARSEVARQLTGVTSSERRVFRQAGAGPAQVEGDRGEGAAEEARWKLAARIAQRASEEARAGLHRSRRAQGGPGSRHRGAAEPDADVRRRAREVLVRWTGRTSRLPRRGRALPSRTLRPRGSGGSLAAVVGRETERRGSRASRRAHREDRARPGGGRRRARLDPPRTGNVPSILEAMKKEGHSIHLVRALEQITGKHWGCGPRLAGSPRQDRGGSSSRARRAGPQPSRPNGFPSTTRWTSFPPITRWDVRDAGSAVLPARPRLRWAEEVLNFRRLGTTPRHWRKYSSTGAQSSPRIPDAGPEPREAHGEARRGRGGGLSRLREPRSSIPSGPAKVSSSRSPRSEPGMLAPSSLAADARGVERRHLLAMAHREPLSSALPVPSCKAGEPREEKSRK